LVPLKLPLSPIRPLVENLAELFKDFSQVHDVFLDDPLSRFEGLFAPAKLVVGWFASVLFRVRHQVCRFSFRTWPRFNALMTPMRHHGGPVEFDQQQDFYRGLPLLEILLGLGKLLNKVGGVL
jgi:hypothetical protein